jgi:hypothetical protein
MRKLLLLSLAASVPLVAGCGGSGGAAPQETITVIHANAPQATQSVATTTAPAKKTTHAKAHAGNAAHASSSAASSTTANQPPVPLPTSPTDPSKQPVSHVKGPSPLRCLAIAGLLAPHYGSAGEASAVSSAVGQFVYVDGPFKNRASASASAQSLQGLEDVEAAHLYVVSARLDAHLHKQVAQVAGCLDGVSGTGFLSF